MIIIECTRTDLVRLEAVSNTGVNTREIDDSLARIEVGMECGPKPYGLLVTVAYAAGDGWTATVGAVRAGVPIAWPARIAQGREPGSLRVEIECPGETPTRLCPRLSRPL